MVKRVKGREKKRNAVCALNEVLRSVCSVSVIVCPALHNYLAPPNLRSGHLLYHHIAKLYEECTTKHRTDGSHSGKAPPAGCWHDDVVSRSFQDGGRRIGGVPE